MIRRAEISCPRNRKANGLDTQPSDKVPIDYPDSRKLLRYPQNVAMDERCRVEQADEKRKSTAVGFFPLAHYIGTRGMIAEALSADKNRSARTRSLMQSWGLIALIGILVYIAETFGARLSAVFAHDRLTFGASSLFPDQQGLTGALWS